MAQIQPIPASAPLKRATTFVLDPTDETPSFRIGTSEKSYHHQYSNIYYHRLHNLRDFVEERARQKWTKPVDDTPVPVFVERVLEVNPGQVCYIVGTVYLDMPLKPNVMEDIARDNNIAPPPPPPKFCSPEDAIMLEDESGRIKLVNSERRDLSKEQLVTGVVIGVLGIETPDGDFSVVDVCYSGFAPSIEPVEEEEDAMDVDEPGADEWIAVVSGLFVGGSDSPDASLEMMIEFLSGEEGGVEDQVSAAQVSRLIIAGDSFAPVVPVVKVEEVKLEGEDKKIRGRYGQDVSTFSAHPTTVLASHLQDIGSVMPIHILPGEQDPSGVILPQQPFPRAMMGPVSSLPSFSCETNPTYLRIGAGSEEAGAKKPISRTVLVNSGQPLNDIFKYLESPPATRLSVLESTLRWRHMAPTAPDTLWCHPYFQSDPFLLQGTPDIYLVGGQKRFATKLVGGDEAKCRIVLIPEFASTGKLVLVNLRTLDVKTRTFTTTNAMNGVKIEVEQV